MKSTSVALLGVLAALHMRGGNEATALPLSMFRDGNDAWLGYSAFAILILLGAVIARAAYRCGEFPTCVLYAAAIVMLLFIAATPSGDPFHILISLLLPLMFHAFYFTLMRSLLGNWTFLHLVVPLLLSFAMHFHSFGAWQKGMMLYFVYLANLHYALLPHTVQKKTRKLSTSNVDRDIERLIAEGWIDRRAALSSPRR